MTQSNPYEKSGLARWWGKSEDTMVLPGGASSERTALDDKARQDLDQGKRHYQAKEYDKAQPIFSTITKAKKLPQDVLEESIFYLGECQRLQGNYRDAEGSLKLYIKSFPYGRFASQANERLFDIANYWLNYTRDEMKAAEEQREGKRTFIMPTSFVHFQRDLPFSDIEGHALLLLEEVRLNDIRGKLAEKSLFYIATVKFFREDYKDADFYYSQLVEHYPNSELTPKAMKQSIICKQIANGGPSYDMRLVEKCRGYLEEFNRAYPGKDADWIQKQLVSINHQQADRDYGIAEFYRRTGHPGSAYFYYELVRRRYPNTDYAEKAQARMNDLRGRVEQEQRLLDPNGTTRPWYDVGQYFRPTPIVTEANQPAVTTPATPAAPGLLPPNLGQLKGS